MRELKAKLEEDQRRKGYNFHIDKKNFSVSGKLGKQKRNAVQHLSSFDMPTITIDWIYSITHHLLDMFTQHTRQGQPAVL